MGRGECWHEGCVSLHTGICKQRLVSSYLPESMRLCFVPVIPVRSAAIESSVAERSARTRREEDKGRLLNDLHRIGQLVDGVGEGRITWSHKGQARSCEQASAPRASQPPPDPSHPSPPFCQFISNPALVLPAVSFVVNPCRSIARRRKMRRRGRITSRLALFLEQRKHCPRRPYRP